MDDKDYYRLNNRMFSAIRIKVKECFVVLTQKASYICKNPYLGIIVETMKMVCSELLCLAMTTANN